MRHRRQDQHHAEAAEPSGRSRPARLALAAVMGLLLLSASALSALSWPSSAESAPPAAQEGAGPSAVAPQPLARPVGDVAAATDPTETLAEELAERLPPCPDGFVVDEVAGCLRAESDGLSEVALLDGSTATVVSPHAHDHDDDTDHENHGDHDHHGASGHPEVDGDLAAGSTSRSRLDTPRRAVTCAPDQTHRTVVLYAHRPGASRVGAHRAAIREVIERSNGLVAGAARASGGPAADLRLRCNGGGRIAVPAIETTGASFVELQDAARRAGFDSDREKYLIFADMASPRRGVAGMAQIHRDDRQSLQNRHNHGNAMYGVVWEGAFEGRTPLHELGHLMGAVQPSAPAADGDFHCEASLDVLCSPRSAQTCSTYTFDCDGDSYFSTAPRANGYLATHWNLGWEGNRFIDVAGRPTPNVPPEAAVAASCDRATCAFDARGSSDVDGFITRLEWDFGDGATATGWRPSHTYAEGGDHTVTLTVVDDRGATDTTTTQITVDHEPATARIDTACEGRDCTYDGAASSHADGEVVAWHWEVDGEVRTGPALTVAWPEDGTYTVRLTVRDDQGWSSRPATATVTVCGTTTLLGEAVCETGGLVDRATGTDAGTKTLEPLREPTPTSRLGLG